MSREAWPVHTTSLMLEHKDAIHEIYIRIATFSGRYPVIYVSRSKVLLHVIETHALREVIDAVKCERDFFRTFIRFA